MQRCAMTRTSSQVNWQRFRRWYSVAFAPGCAGLIGHTKRIIWTVGDDGWIFEARETNRDTAEFHGYPVLPTEAIARVVFNRFSAWVEQHGTPVEESACESCRLRYSF